MTVSTLTQPHRAGRAGFAAFGALLLASAALEATTRDGVAWQIAAFGLGPDVALLLGAARGLARAARRGRSRRPLDAPRRRAPRHPCVVDLQAHTQQARARGRGDLGRLRRAGRRARALARAHDGPARLARPRVPRLRDASPPP